MNKENNLKFDKYHLKKIKFIPYFIDFWKGTFVYILVIQKSMPVIVLIVMKENYNGTLWQPIY